MNLTSFDQIIKGLEDIKDNNKYKRMVVASAESEYTIESVLKVYNLGIIEPILVGDELKIKTILNKFEAKNNNFEIIPTRSKEEAARISVDIIKKGDGDIIMKGLIETATILSALLKRENNMRESELISCLSIFEIEGYHKLLGLTDPAINISPNIMEKKKIIENSVNAMLKMGWDYPKVAVVTAIENVNPKMPETVDANELKKMNIRNQITNCIVEGPISIDIALDKKIADVKGFNSPVAGNADLIIYPNITVANICNKTFNIFGNNKSASIVIGFKIPFILTSRGSSIDDKVRSILLALLLS